VRIHAVGEQCSIGFGIPFVTTWSCHITVTILYAIVIVVFWLYSAYTCKRSMLTNGVAKTQHAHLYIISSGSLTLMCKCFQHRKPSAFICVVQRAFTQMIYSGNGVVCIMIVECKSTSDVCGKLALTATHQHILPIYIGSTPCVKFYSRMFSKQTVLV